MPRSTRKNNYPDPPPPATKTDHQDVVVTKESAKLSVTNDDNIDSIPIARIVKESAALRKCVCREHSGDTRGCPVHTYNANWNIAAEPAPASTVVVASTDHNNVVTDALIALNDDADDDDDDGTIPVASVLENENDDEGKCDKSDEEYKDNGEDVDEDGNDKDTDDDNGDDDEGDSVEVVGESSDDDEDDDKDDIVSG